MGNVLTKRREPFAFMLATAITGIVLIFLALSLFYVLRKSGTDWVSFKMPVIFWWSTGIIIISSITLQQANKFFKLNHFTAYKWLSGITLFLGCVFIATQLIGWQQMAGNGIGMKNPSGAFLYILSGLHILHIAFGLIFLLSAFLNVVKRPEYIDAFVYSVNPPTQLRLKLVAIYWHFVDALWVYLFLFLVYHEG